MSRVSEVDIVVRASMSEKEVDFVEAGDVRDGCIYVAIGVKCRKIHVTFGVDRVWTEHHSARWRDE